MKSAALLALLCLTTLCVGQTAESTILFRYGSLEKLVADCKTTDSVETKDGQLVQPQRDRVRSMTCIAFIMGVVDALSALPEGALATPKEAQLFSLCTPTTASGIQLARVIVKYGNDHPGELHRPAVFGVVFALRDAFPCK